MAESSVDEKKGGGVLKTVGLLLFIPVVALATIAGYHLVPRFVDMDAFGTSDGEPWERSSRSRVNRADQGTTSTPNVPANSAGTPAANSPSGAPPSGGSTQNQGKTTVQQDAQSFAGRWERMETAPNSTLLNNNEVRIYSPPQQQGSDYIGTIVDERGVTFANYKVSPGNGPNGNVMTQTVIADARPSKSPSGATEFGIKKGTVNEYYFKLSPDGKTLTLTVTSEPNKPGKPWSRR